MSSFALLCRLFSPSSFPSLGSCTRKDTNERTQRREKGPQKHGSINSRCACLRKECRRVDRSPSKGTTRVSVASSRLRRNTTRVSMTRFLHLFSAYFVEEREDKMRDTLFPNTTHRYSIETEQPPKTEERAKRGGPPPPPPEQDADDLPPPF